MSLDVLAPPVPEADPDHAKSASAPRQLSAARVFALGGASALLLYLAYFPVAWGWLAWGGLVPLLALAHVATSARRRYAAAWLAGVGFFFPVMQWMRVADHRMYFTWIFLAFVCSLYLPLAVLFTRALSRRLPALPLVAAFPVLWVALEFFRSNFIGGFATAILGHAVHDYPGGFSWYLLGYSQHDVLPLIQIADLGGVYAVSFLVAVGNALLFTVLFSRPGVRAWLCSETDRSRGKRALLLQGLAFLLLLASAVGYGFARLGEGVGEPGPRLALVQGNLDQRIRNTIGSPDPVVREEATRQMVYHFHYLSELAAQFDPDLIVWPETSLVDPWVELRPGEPAPVSEKLAAFVHERYRTNVLLGLNSVVKMDEGQRRYNSALLINDEGKPAGRYDKTHRVPIGEYIPFRKSLPFLNRLAPYDYDYSVAPGGRFTRFPVNVGDTTYTFGVVICYEDTFPDMARPYGGGDGERPADFLINISNDGWFDGTAEHAEHLAMCRFRAVENRRGVARAVNMGISAVIDGNGRVLAPRRVEIPPLEPMPEAHVWRIGGDAAELPVGEWGEYKKVSGVLLATMPIDTRASFYARWGDWLGWGCLTALLAGLVVGWIRGFVTPRVSTSS